MSKLGVFIKDTFTKITKSISFLTMLLTPLVVIGIIIAIGYFAEQTFSEMGEVEVAVISESPGISEMIDDLDESIQVVQEITTEEEASEQLQEEAIDGYFVIDVQGDTVQATVTHDNSLTNHVPLIEQALTSTQVMLRAQELGISPEDIQNLNEPVLLENNIVSIDDGELVEEDGLAAGIAVGSAYFINIMVMMFIMFYASTVIEEVAGEKGTRMMEVILSSTTATTHFFGKIIGVFLVMLAHVLFYILAALGAFLYFRNSDFVVNLLADIDLGAVLLEFLRLSSVFLFIGVIMYMFIAAFLGSLITKAEDVNRAATPLTLIVLLGFYIGFFAMAVPENPVVVVSSFIPLLTPFVMPFRIATNTVSNLHVWLSGGGSFLFTVLLAYVSLIFYRANVLIYSDTNVWNTIKQSWTLIRSENKSTI